MRWQIIRQQPAEENTFGEQTKDKQNVRPKQVTPLCGENLIPDIYTQINTDFTFISKDPFKFTENKVVKVDRKEKLFQQ